MMIFQGVLTGLVVGTVLATQALADSADPGRRQERGHQVVTIDHFVPHVSNVPANRGELVHLFVRERTSGSGLCACDSAGEDGRAEEHEDGDNGSRRRQAVLFVHSRSVPVVPLADLGSDDYNWALSLARAGIDVFMMDFQGSGMSPRPRMDDACNVPIAQQQALLVPNPLQNTCTPTYASALNTAESDLAELDRIVDYIRDLRRIDKLHLISWSQGSFRIGPYAIDHPEKVASVFFLAPIFNKDFDPAAQPRPTTPMTLRTRANFFAGDGKVVGWDPEIKCEGQREAGIQDAVWVSIMDNDRLGRTWGPPPAGAPAGSAPEGVARVREVFLPAWNAAVAAGTPAKPGLNVPTLIIRGEFDTGQGGRQHLAELYSYVNNPNKLRFTVQCAGHHMQWEKQRTVLHDISRQWIKHGRVAGNEQGEFMVDAQGNIAPM